MEILKGAARVGGPSTAAEPVLLVIKLLLCVVREHLVCLRYLLKLQLSRLVWVQIWVVLLSQLEVRKFDIFVGRIWFEAKHI